MSARKMACRLRERSLAWRARLSSASSARRSCSLRALSLACFSATCSQLVGEQGSACMGSLCRQVEPTELREERI